MDELLNGATASRLKDPGPKPPYSQLLPFLVGKSNNYKVTQNDHKETPDV